MQYVKQLDYFKNIREVREFEFGSFYFFDGLVISEINKGVFFRWKMAEKAVKAAKEFYKEEQPIAYISNRIHSYTVAPTDWLKFYNHRHELAYYSVVGSTKGSLPSTLLEKMFFKGSLMQFNELDEAIAWSLEKLEAYNSARL
ncbi:hypothetical protein [Maribacter antarcticus]|uniref:hypothetical protein n=1 Tax=Maribacter antarcticus TaxID=505250 RepID=UPI00047D71FF|nr:hypothetical protein [Maribacter antarcticus]